MAIKRKTYRFRRGAVIDVEEFHDGRYGAPGVKRNKRAKPTEEQMRAVNAMNKARRCRHRLLEYFKPGDIWATWTYSVQNRPPNMAAALKDFQKAMRYVRKEYKKRGYEVFWIRNIEQGTRGAWHIHLIINEIGDTASIIQKAWEKGGTWFTEIRKSQYYDEDFTKLASYITKDQHTVEAKKDGTPKEYYRSAYRRPKWNDAFPCILKESDGMGGMITCHPGRLQEDGTYSDARAYTVLELLRGYDLPHDFPFPAWTLDEDKLQRAVLGEAFAPRLVQRILEFMPR